MAHADAGGYVDVCDPCCGQKACESPQSVLPLAVKDMEATFAMVLMTSDSQLRKRDIEGFCDTLYIFIPKEVTA